MQAELTDNSHGKQKIILTFDTRKEIDIFNTLIGYYPYHSMEQLRIEFGNKFPNVNVEEVRAMVSEIAKVLPIK